MTSPESPKNRRSLWLAAAMVAVIAAIWWQWRASPVQEGKGETPSEGGRPAAALADNLVLITIDTLRSDALGFAGNRQVETPNLDRLAETGMQFTFAHAHNTITLPSHTNILTGLYPYQHGVRENAGFTVPDHLPTLATIAKEAGFATGAVVAAFPLDIRFGLQRGFDFYDDRYPDGGDNPFRLAQRPGHQVVPQAVRWWRENDARRRLLWLHLFDPHAPYEPPEPFAEAYPEATYLGEVAAADRFVGELLQPFLEGREPSTFIVFVADHGEGLGDHGERSHGIFAYETTLKVPLVIWGPGVEPGTDERLARHIDLLPTMLAAAGLEEPADLPGYSLLGPPPGEPLTSYFEALSGNLNRGWAPLRGMLRDRTKFIDLPIPELYDLATDPDEQANIIDRERRQARELRALLPAESEWPPQRGDIPAELEANLRSLGYLTDSAPIKDRYSEEDDPKRLTALDAKLHQINDHYELGEYEQARELSQELIDLRPEMPLGYTFLSQTLIQMKRTGEAIEVMELAVQRGHASASLKRQLGLSLSWVGRSEEAIAVLSPLVEQRPDTATLSALGHALTQAGRARQAFAALERALALDATDSLTYERLSAAALQMQRWPAARDYAQQAIDLDAHLDYAWNNLGVALYQLGEPRQALAAWQQSVKLNPEQFDTLYNIGLTAANLGEVEMSRQALRRFLERAPRERYAQDLPKVEALLRQLGG